MDSSFECICSPGAFRNLLWYHYFFFFFFNHCPIQLHDHIWSPHRVVEARLYVPITICVIHTPNVGLAGSPPLTGAPLSPEPRDEKNVQLLSNIAGYEAAAVTPSSLLAGKALCPARVSEKVAMHCVRGRASCKASFPFLIPGSWHQSAVTFPKGSQVCMALSAHCQEGSCWMLPRAGVDAERCCRSQATGCFKD